MQDNPVVNPPQKQDLVLCTGAHAKFATEFWFLFPHVQNEDNSSCKICWQPAQLNLCPSAPWFDFEPKLVVESGPVEFTFFGFDIFAQDHDDIMVKVWLCCSPGARRAVVAVYLYAKLLLPPWVGDAAGEGLNPATIGSSTLSPPPPALPPTEVLWVAALSRKGSCPRIPAPSHPYFFPKCRMPENACAPLVCTTLGSTTPWPCDSYPAARTCWRWHGSQEITGGYTRRLRKNSRADRTGGSHSYYSPCFFTHYPSTACQPVSSAFVQPSGAIEVNRPI